MAHAPTTTAPIYGFMAEYDSPDSLVACAKAARDAGYTEMEAYSPMPIHGLSDVLGYKSILQRFVLFGGLVGMCTGFGLCYWVSAMEYPLNVGGRPWNSWPAFIVPTFETTILFACLTAFVGMLAINGLPQPYHPVFNVARFSEATRSKFFFLILSRDPKFDLEGTKGFLARLKPLSVAEVPH